jgi:hypothetical protein
VASTRVTYRRDAAGWWFAQAARPSAAHTQGRTLDQARRRMVEAAHAATGTHLDFHELVLLPAPLDIRIREARSARHGMAIAAHRATKLSRHAARAAVSAGLSLRDVGTLLGLSRQRVHQLLEIPEADAAVATTPPLAVRAEPMDALPVSPAANVILLSDVRRARTRRGRQFGRSQVGAMLAGDFVRALAQAGSDG